MIINSRKIQFRFPLAAAAGGLGAVLLLGLVLLLLYPFCLGLYLAFSASLVLGVLVLLISLFSGGSLGLIPVVVALISIFSATHINLFMTLNGFLHLP